MGNTTVLTTVLASLLIASPQPAQPQVTLNTWLTLQPTVYEVKRGDSLSTIAQEVYGDSEYWTVLWKDNTWIENPKILYSEWKLAIRKEKPQQLETVLPPDLEKKLAALQEQARIQLQTAYIPESKANAQTSAVVSEPHPSNYDEVYKAAGEKYVVPWQILYGLHLTESGLQGSGNIKNKSGTGATGPMQFMPSTWRAYGVDGNGDGNADIANVEDAIYGAANYLQKHGSLQQGLRSYGGNQSKTLQAAYQRGYDPNTN